MVEFLLTLGFISASMASFFTNYLLYTKLEAEQVRTRMLERKNYELRKYIQLTGREHD